MRYCFLIGSAKSGTTKLADLLNLHPDICVSSDKEPDTFVNNEVNDNVILEYNKLFNSISALRIDASTSYTECIDSTDVAKKLHQLDANAKILYIIRDPAKRAWSSYWHYVRNGSEKRVPMIAIKDNSSPHFIGSCFCLHVKNYESIFGRQNIRIIEFEDFVKNTDSIYKQIISFLDLDDFPLRDSDYTETKNKSYQWRGFSSVLRFVHPKFIQKLTRNIKLLLPDFLWFFIKRLTTKPVPVLNTSDYKILKQLFQEDLDSLYCEYDDIFIRSRSI